ncbi:hypothetical protein TNIN_196911 [Trichonephila inaurata madagascariensis]|uniref:Uncharacterized protein n=1 Tax=Trichonephila inaurata madagascariensis TaxID=2747483 RepID=A0A8X6XGF5_9ARAC|nr:hypothetical protein TNIN_196911 [Trichonephila inaurata madagascariensis]
MIRALFRLQNESSHGVCRQLLNSHLKMAPPRQNKLSSSQQHCGVQLFVRRDIPPEFAAIHILMSERHKARTLKGERELAYL